MSKKTTLSITLVPFFGLLFSVASCSGEPAGHQEQELQAGKAADPKIAKVDAMTTSQIVEFIKQKDWAFTEQPVQIDPAEVPELIALCKDSDPEIRELTLYALSGILGPEARKCILEALHDDDINVRSAATRFLLENFSDGDIKALHAELSDNPDEMVRESVALTLGKIGDPYSKMAVQDRSAVEVDPDAAHAMHLALVRLHDDKNRMLYAQRLRDADPKIRAKAIQDFEYIQDREFVAHIAPLLNDQHPALNIGPSNKKIFIRVCDVAVNVLDKVLNHPFGFEVDEFKTYTPEELAQAAETVQGMQ
jgi:HEAT repeat protein